MRIDIALVDVVPLGVDTRRGSARARANDWRPKGQTMSQMKIAYQGEPGANSHIACVENFPDYEPLPCATFEDAFAALRDGAAELGMIPIENSIAGRVADIHNLLPASNLHIIGETFLPIHFQLLALAGRGDCRTCAASTATSTRSASAARSSANSASSRSSPATPRVRRARSRRRRSARAPRLATSLAGEIYGLKTLRDNVEDEAHNTTRFVVLSKTPKWAPAGDGAGVDDVRLPRPQRAGGALQGARRLRHQWRQHDEARKLHGRRRVHRHAVPRRRRRPSRGPAAGPRAGGTERSSRARCAFSASIPPTRSASARADSRATRRHDRAAGPEASGGLSQAPECTALRPNCGGD